jgi:surface antigen
MPSCKYCGSSSPAGYQCNKSPTKGHVVDSGANKCIYCGSSSPAGYQCDKSPTKGHVHGGGII